VHLPVLSRQTAIGVEHHGSVVVHAGGAALEKRSHDGDLELARQGPQRLRAGPGDRLRLREARVILALAEIEAAVEFGEANDLRARPGGLPDRSFSRSLVLACVVRAAHLDEADPESHRGGKIAHPLPSGNEMMENP
jgi:hypothetical protein